MRQKLCKRLEELEKICAAAAARRAETNSDYEEAFARLRAEVEAWHADPVNQKWLAEQPPDHLHRGLRSLQAELEQRASGHSRPFRAGGFR